MNNDDRAKLEALPAFDDPHVQIVYRILCDTDLVPPPDEHWEGFTARHVVAALASAQAASAEPVAPFAQDRVADLVVRLRDESGGHINGLYDREAADALEEMALLADSEGSRAVRYLRRARAAEAALTTPAALATRTPEPQAERTVEVHMDREHGGLAFGPHPDSRGQAREGWRSVPAVAEHSWLCEVAVKAGVWPAHEQDAVPWTILEAVKKYHAAMLSASPTPDEQRAQAAQEDVEATVERLMNRARHAAVVESAHDRNNATDQELRFAWNALREALRAALAGRQQL